MFCQKCGTRVEPGDLFCQNCGNQLAGGKPPSSSLGPPAPVLKASFMAQLKGTDKPTGTVNDAWRLLRSGDIKSGRALLRRICKHEPQNLNAHILVAYDYMRPPENRSEGVKFLRAAVSLAPGSCEVESLYACSSAGNVEVESATFAYDSFLRAGDKPPRSVHGNAIMFLAELRVSDLTIQIIWRPVGSKIEKMFVNYAVKGAAQLLLRRADALATFQQGYANASSSAESYEKLFDFSLAPTDRQAIAELLQRHCLIGQGLALRDTGRVREAREVWETVRPMMRDSQSVRMLIEEEV